MIAVKKFLMFPVTLLLVPACTWFTPDVQRIDSFEQVKTVSAQVTQQTLVVFDMDQTLMNPTEYLFNLVWMPLQEFDPADYAFIQNFRKKSEDLAAKRGGTRYREEFISAIWGKTDFVPVEQGTIAFVKKLQAQGAKVIALTSSNTGKFGFIENMQQWRVDNLHQIGLDFSASFEVREIVFPELPDQYDYQGGSPAIFYQGILCAARNPKGKVLATFLDKIGWKPTNILFFDDSKEQCESVASEMKKRGIPTKSYWYRAAYQKKIKLDQQLVKYQFDYWVMHEKFLSTPEAKELLKHEQYI